MSAVRGRYFKNGTMTCKIKHTEIIDKTVCVLDSVF